MNRNFMKTVIALAACALAAAGCSTEKPVTPAPADGLAVTLAEAGAVRVAARGHQVAITPVALRVLSAAGEELAVIEAGASTWIEGDGQSRMAGTYPGVDLVVHDGSGQLRRGFVLYGPLDLPRQAAWVEFVDLVNDGGALDAVAATGEGLEEGSAVEAGGWRLENGRGEDVLHAAPAVGWDRLGRNRPWVEWRLERNAAGGLQTATRLPYAWVSDETAPYPLTLMLSYAATEPNDLVASMFVARTAPGSSTLSVAATYANAWNDSLEVRIAWGDGQEHVSLTNMPIHVLHEYRTMMLAPALTIQLSDFARAADGGLQPRIYRERIPLRELIGPTKVERRREP
jgi:hypothetical protein